MRKKLALKTKRKKPEHPKIKPSLFRSADILEMREQDIQFRCLADFASETLGVKIGLKDREHAAITRMCSNLYCIKSKKT